MAFRKYAKFKKESFTPLFPTVVKQIKSWRRKMKKLNRKKK
jgi:hypothetical protein